MIDWVRSADLNSVSVDALKKRFDRFPHSGKMVVAICDNPDCKKERVLRYDDYHEFCNKCAHTSDAFRSKQSDNTIQQNIDHPISTEDRSARAKQYYIDNPEMRVIASEKKKLYHINNPEASKRAGAKQKQYYKDHPEVIQRIREKNIQNSVNNPGRARAARLKYFKDNPDAGRRNSALQQGIPFDEWNGYSKATEWRDWSEAIYMNAWFGGCHRHHITKTIVVHIPAELHNHIPHTLKNGYNMGEINMLALQFINGGYDG